MLNGRVGVIVQLIRRKGTWALHAVPVVVGLALVFLVGSGYDRAEAAPIVFATHSSKAAAVTADAVFSSIKLPPEARSLSHLSSSRLSTLGYYEAAQNSGVNRVGVWELPLSINKAATFLEHLAPAGLRHQETTVDVEANEAGVYGGTVSFQSQPIATSANTTTPFTRVSYALTAATRDKSPTDVVVGVQVVWGPPRTPAEDLPAGTTTVKITRTGFHLGKVQQIVSTRSVTSTSSTEISRFAAILDRLQPDLLGQPVSCSSPNITASTTLFIYRLAFTGGTRSLTLEYGSCGNVSVTANGRSQPPLDDAPQQAGAVRSQPLSNEIESVFSPGRPLTYYGS